MSELIIIIIFIIFFIGLQNACANIGQEPFSASRTAIVYSNYEIDHQSDKFAKVNEEILILEQHPGKERVMKFKNIRVPLNTNIAIYIRKDQEGGQITINTYLFKTDTIVNNLITILGKNNLLTNDLSNVIRYYVKVLDDKTYAYEKKKYDEIMVLRDRYRQCIDVKKTTMNLAVAVDECKKVYKNVI